MKAEDIDLLEEAKRIAYAAPQIIPILENQRQQALDILLGRFREGKTNLLAEVAKVEALVALEIELTTKVAIFESKIAKIEGKRHE